MNLLLHTCCAPCSVYCIKSLRAEKIEPTLFWYNPNIHPYSEYKARRDCLKEYAKTKEPYDKAGGYAIQGFVGKFIDRVDGDFFTVIGLPKSTVYEKVNNYLRNK